MTTFALPALATLDQPPSWCNTHGRLDRSACIEVRISEVRRIAGCVRDKPRIWPDMNKVRLPVQPLPNEQSARNTDGRIASGFHTITAEQVDFLQRRRLPRRLAGDWRTTRANAMRPHYYRPDDGFALRRPHNADLDEYEFDVGLPGNPNHGATRTKMIGITEHWSQTLRIEKWVFPGRIAPAYYLICPGTFHVDVECPPPLSTCGAGRKATGCPQRTLKLLMVQCTPDEWRDANLVQTWMDSLGNRRTPAIHRDMTRLLQRYGPILPPRQLLCARCLGVRYGNNPENARQSWRRLNNKPDARPAKRNVTRSNNHTWARTCKQKRKRR